jgi:hypothetical protein
MVHVVNDIGQEVVIPDWVVDLESFRRWAAADVFPETGRIWFLNDEVWVDMSQEQVFTHVGVKTEYTAVLAPLARTAMRGRYLTDGVKLTNIQAGISGNPDGVYVSYEALTAKRMVLVEGMEEGYLELEGSPDMVLEVISRSSVRKDRITLRQAYWEAGIREYWLVDARKSPPTFDILRQTAKGYAATRKQDGWIKSAVFQKSFRLTQSTDPLGHPEYTLEVR